MAERPPPAGAPRSTPPGSPPSTCSRPSASTTPTPTSRCRRSCASTGSPGRDAAFATELVVRHHPAPGHLRRHHRRLPDQAPARGQGPRRRCGSAPTSCCPCGCPTTRPSARRSSSPAPRVGPGPRRPVNAVLRKVAAHDLDGWVAGSRPTRRRPVRLRSRRPLPPPLGGRGAGRARSPSARRELEALLAADNAPPRVMLVARPGLATVEELVAAGGTATPLSPYAVELRRRRPRRRSPPSPRGAPACRTRARSWSPSPWPTRRSRAATSAGSTCAPGPGGKAALLAALAGRAGRAAAGQRAPAAPRRAGRPRAAPRAPGCSAWSPATAPARRGATATFDRVLVDAPCSGLGALRRRRSRAGAARPSDLEALVPLQRALLTRRSTSLRPGGVVVYATCSPVLAETTEVVDAVVGGRDDVAGRRGPPALAAPRRHRRDVHRHVAPGPDRSGRPKGVTPAMSSVP